MARVHLCQNILQQKAGSNSGNPSWRGYRVVRFEQLQPCFTALMQVRDFPSAVNKKCSNFVETSPKLWTLSRKKKKEKKTPSWMVGEENTVDMLSLCSVRMFWNVNAIVKKHLSNLAYIFLHIWTFVVWKYNLVSWLIFAFLNCFPFLNHSRSPGARLLLCPFVIHLQIFLSKFRPKCLICS